MKRTKKQAFYTEGVYSFTRRCGACSLFRAPSSCSLVEGHILTDSVCQYWKPRRAGMSKMRMGGRVTLEVVGFLVVAVLGALVAGIGLAAMVRQ